MSELKAERTNPWWAGSQSLQGLFVEVWCGNAYACVFLPSDGKWDITLGYKDEEESLPVCTTAEELADWATMTKWLTEQPWPKWTAP